MVDTLQRLVLPFLCVVFAAFAVVAPPSPAEAHDGDQPHANNTYDQGTNHVTFDKDADVDSRWQFNQKGNAIDSNFFGPNLIFGECENTTGPCMNVQQVCAPQQDWTYQFDTNYYAFNPQHGRLRLNPCNGGDAYDISVSCRSIMRILGSHPWSAPGNNTCLDNPWYLSEDSATEGDFDALNQAYGIVDVRSSARKPCYRSAIC